MFDRLTGGNKVLPKDDETQPPYDFGKLLTKMSSTQRNENSHHLDRSLDAKLHIQSAANSTVKTIIPSITDTIVNVDANTLKISGFFGQSQGAITLDGNILTPVSWSESTIVVEKPEATSGKLVVRSLGADSPAGYLFSQTYDYKGLGLELTPPGAALPIAGQQAFSVAVTNGEKPAGSSFKWTLTGNGKINGGNVVSGQTTSVNYKASNSPGVDTLKVQLISNGTAIAEKITSIVVGGESSIEFTLSGNWDSSKTPPNGHYVYTDGQGARFSPNPGLDAVTCSYDIGQTDQTIGVLITAMVVPGSELVNGQSFNHFHTGDPGDTFVAGMYQITLATNQGDPDNSNSSQYAIGNAGTMTIVSVTTLTDGSKYIQYTFTATNGIGGTITGSGACKVIKFN